MVNDNPTPLNELASRIHEVSSDHGFWPKEGRNFGEMIALAHSELSEALEEHREGKPDVYFVTKMESTPEGILSTDKPEGVSVELVDALIRILDTLHSRGVDIDDIVFMKMAYNASRPHKHGKSY